jgi:hypothetical protein
MSFKKIKVISPEKILNGPRNPEKGYVYLGYGNSSTWEGDAPWIKKDDGTFFMISGGTGSAGVSYWQLSGTELKPESNLYNVIIGGNTSGSQKLNVSGAINLGDTNVDTIGSIRWTGIDFQGNTGGTSTDWVSLTSGSVGPPTPTSLWVKYGSSNENIKTATGYNDVYIPNNTFVGGGVPNNTDPESLTIGGAINIGVNSATTPVDGTIRYDSSSNAGAGDFEGYIGTKWYSLTGSIATSAIVIASPNYTLDDEHKTILWNRATDGVINLPNPTYSTNREYDIVKMLPLSSSLAKLELVGYKINMYGSMYGAAYTSTGYNGIFSMNTTNNIKSVRIKALGDTWYVINMTVLVPPIANWIASGDNYNAFQGDNIQFEELSTGSMSMWHWEWGDGSSDTYYTQQNTTHSWSNVGYHTVTLTVTGPDGSNTTHSHDVHIMTPA